MPTKLTTPKAVACILLNAIGLMAFFFLRGGHSDESTETAKATVRAQANTPAKTRPAEVPTNRTPDTADVTLTEEQAKVELAEEGQYASLGAALTAARHAVETIEPGNPHARGAEYFAANPGQQLRAWFSKDGVELASGIPTPEGEEPWNVALRAEQIGRGSTWQPIRATTSSAEGSRMEASDPETGVTQWFVNRTEGLEQGFTLQRRPEGRGHEVAVRMAVEGSLRAEPFSQGDREGVRFVDAEGRETVHYTGLRAWDSAGRDLAAGMKVHGSVLELVVNDHNAVYPVTIDPLFSNVEARLQPAFVGGQFGRSVAVSGDRALVGAHQGSTLEAGNVGFAYVFVRDGTRWRPEAKLSAPDAEDGAAFGWSVALDGDTALVGGPFIEIPDQPGKLGAGLIFVRSGTAWIHQAQLVGSGSASARAVALDGDTALLSGGTGAFVFQRVGTSWTEQAFLPNQRGSKESVAIDGDTVVVSGSSTRIFVRSGAIWSEEANLGNAGHSVVGFAIVALKGDTVLVGPEVFVRTGTTWTNQATLVPDNGMFLGGSRSLDGDTAILRSFFEQNAYVFVRSGDQWTQQATVSPSGGEMLSDSVEGSSVALSGNTALLGTQGQNAYVIVRNGTTWSEEDKLDSGQGADVPLLWFGSTVAVSGNTALVGAPGDDLLTYNGAGSTYVFVRSGTTWREQAKLVDSDPATSGGFGSAIALDEDTALVWSSGIASVFVRSATGWPEQARLAPPGPGFVNEAVVDVDGDTAVIGAPIETSAYVFGRSGTTWSFETELTASDTVGVPGRPPFGSAVSVSGQTVLVGAPLRSFTPGETEVGSVYVFVKMGTSWTEEAKITVTENPRYVLLGSSVALSGDTALLGAVERTNPELIDFDPDLDEGTAYVFVRSGSVWQQQARLVASDGAPLAVGDFFPAASNLVALDGDTALVGAPTDDIAAGSAYVFVRNGILWSEQLTLTAGVDSRAFNNFGYGVALDGGIAAVGTFPDPGVSRGTDISAAYTFLLGELPEITQQPASRTVVSGQSVSFSIIASGYQPLNYQWRKNGTNIEGAGGELLDGTTSFTIPEVTVADAGLYDVVVSNAGGIVTSAAATLLVNNLSQISQTFPDDPDGNDGSILVITEPTEIGAAWRFAGEQLWRAPGIAINGLTSGIRTVEFRPVPGYATPAPVTAPILSGGTTVFIEGDYGTSSGSGTAVLSVALLPLDLANEPVEADRAQWRLHRPGIPDASNPWLDSEQQVTGLVPGDYEVEFKLVAGWIAPFPATYAATDSPAGSPIAEYKARAPGASPTIVPIETVWATTSLPYSFVGQLRGDGKFGTGFLVKKRVVATAAHVVFDGENLCWATSMQWIFQQDREDHQPVPKTPRGYCTLSGYDVQWDLEADPGPTSSPALQQLDVAALWFFEDAGRGGSGGFLASNSVPDQFGNDGNEWLLSDALKLTVGYPVNGIDPDNVGRIHATQPTNLIFTPGGSDHTYATQGIQPIGGSSGSPLYVQLEGGLYYAAGVLLGGNGQAVVRTFDGEVVELFNTAEAESNGGDNVVGGGSTLTGIQTLSSDPEANGAIQVNVSPPPQDPTDGVWRFSDESQFARRHEGLVSGLEADKVVTIQFKALPGYVAPAPAQVQIQGGKLLTITFEYAGADSIEAWRLEQFNTTANSGDAADDADPDMDGRTNIEEFAAGTDPNNPNDFFTIIEPTKSGSTFSAKVSGKAGRIYKLQRNPSLGGTWTTIATEGPLVIDGEVTLSDSSAPAGSGYYRIEVSVP